MIRTTKFALAVATCISMASVGLVPTANADAPGAVLQKNADVNALWNDSQGLGFWIYGDHLSLASGYLKGVPFLFVGAAGPHSGYSSGTLDVESLQGCALFDFSGKK